MSYLSKGRSVAVVEEVSYGAASPTFVDANYVDYTGADITTDIASLDRAVVRDSMVALESLLGTETSSGSITVEISGDRVTEGVNGHLLYKNGFGSYIPKTTATDVATATSTTVFTVTSSTGLTQGQIIKVSLGTGDEFVTIESIAIDELTVVPALSVTPTVTDAVVGLTTYILPKPADSVASLAVRENLKPQSGTVIDYDYLGVVVSDVALSYPVGNIATAQFTLAGAGFTVTSPGSTVTLPCTLNTPIVGKNAVLTVQGSSFTAQDLAFNVTSSITDIQSVTTDGITNKVGIDKAVTGTLKTEYLGEGNFTKFQAGTKGELMLQVRDGGKTSPMTQIIYMPNIKFTKVTRSEDGGILYDNIEFQALSPTCSTNERAVSVAFA